LVLAKGKVMVYCC